MNTGAAGVWVEQRMQESQRGPFSASSHLTSSGKRETHRHEDVILRRNFFKKEILLTPSLRTDY